MHNGKRVIAICTSDLDQKFHIRLLKRVVREITNLGYYTVMFSMDTPMYLLSESEQADASVFDLIHLDIVDVVVMFSETIRQQEVLEHIVSRVTAADIPVISVGKDVDQCYNVIYDEDTAFEELVRHVVEYHNVKEINFISGIKGNEVAERRLEIYQRVLEENSILFEPERVGYGDFWEMPTRKVMDEFIAPNKMYPEAIICANDSMAVAACDYLREHHIHVPDDIIVTGFDGIEEGIKYTPGITTCVRNEVQDAKAIAELVWNLCNGSQVEITTVLDYHIQLSQSCGCQKNHIYDADALVAQLNHDLALHRFSVHRYAQMQEQFLTCKTDEDYMKLISDYLPDNSFLCINDGLSIEKPVEDKRGDAKLFTEKLNAIGKIDGKIYKGDCFREKVVPEFGKDVSQDLVVAILPFHFDYKVLGYMGLWLSFNDKVDLDDTIYFILCLDESAGLRLAMHLG